MRRRRGEKEGGLSPSHQDLLKQQKKGVRTPVSCPKEKGAKGGGGVRRSQLKKKKKKKM